MNNNRKTFLILTVFLALFLGACVSPGTDEPTQPVTTPATPEPGNLPNPTATLDDNSEVTFDPSDPLNFIQKFLYESQNILPGEVQVILKEEREWSDSCLGLGGADELCLQVITPGYLVVVDTPKGQFTFHTELTMQRFRLDTGDPGELPTEFDSTTRFQWLLAGRLDLPLDQVTLLKREAVDWPNACLGVEEPGVMCAEVITPGFRLTFSTPQGEVVIHTNATMAGYRTPEPLPGEDRPLLEWERSGGIAGICEQLRVAFDGDYELSDCNSQTVLFAGVLDLAKYEELIAKASTYGVTTWQFESPEGAADLFNDRYTLHGKGSETADTTKQEMLNGIFDSLVQYIKGQPTSE
jgi:hypothetical protein